MKRGFLFLVGIFAMMFILGLFVYSDYSSNSITGYEVLGEAEMPTEESNSLMPSSDSLSDPSVENTETPTEQTSGNEESLIIEDITQETLQTSPPFMGDTAEGGESNDYITILFGQELDSNKILKIAAILGGTIIVILILIWFLKGRGKNKREEIYIAEYAATDSVHDMERVLNLGEYYLAIGELDKSKRMYEEIKKLYEDLTNQKLSIPEYQRGKILNFYEKLNSAITKLSVGGNNQINPDKNK